MVTQGRAFGDAAALREAVYAAALDAVRQAPPVSNRSHTLRLSNVAYAEPGAYSKAQQKAAVLESRTLGRKLKGTWELVDNATGNVLDSREQVLARVPFVTDRGTFIHNGSEYAVAHQQRLRSGVFVRRKANGELEAHANVLPGQGFSHRYNLDPAKGTFHLEVGQGRLPLMPLLRLLGAHDTQLRDAWGSDVLAANMAKDDPSSLRKLQAKLLTPRDLADGKDPRTALQEKFAGMALDPDVTRRTLGQPHAGLTLDAMLATTSKLLAVHRGEAEVDDRDHLAYQTFHGPEDLIAERLGRDHGRLRRQLLNRAAFRGDLKAMPSSALQPQADAALLSSGLGQNLEEVNTAELLDKQTRISRMGEGGIPSLDSIPEEARAVQPSHLGFMDPVRTPESMRAGVDLNLASGARKLPGGEIAAQFRDVRTGQAAWKTPREMADATIAFPGSLARPGKRVAAMKGGKIGWVPRGEVDYELPHFEGAFSPLANMIPLKSMTKGQRVAMGSRMLTQALPLAEPEAPLVRTGIPGSGGKSYEEEYGTAMGAVRAGRDGVVAAAGPDRVHLQHDDGTTTEHELHQHFPFNRKTFVTQRPVVRPGQRVRAGDLLAASNYTDSQGVTALGRNARVAYVPWGGLNHEDALVISESFAKKFTSEHAYQHELPVDDKTKIGKASYLTFFPARHSPEHLAALDADGLIRPGTPVTYGQPLALAVRERERTRDKLHKPGQAGYSDAALTWEHHDPGVVTDVAHGKDGPVVVVKSRSVMSIGDKMSGRYGDKGVVADIVPDALMPHDQTGRPFEVLLNPLGVISRCYDQETEFLTASGWKLGIDLQPLEPLYCFDSETGKLVVQTPKLPLNIQEYKGLVYQYESVCVSFCVTPGHAFWVAEYDLPDPSVLDFTGRDHERPFWRRLMVEDVIRGDFLVPAATSGHKARHDWDERISIETPLTGVVMQRDHWRSAFYDGLIFCPTVPSGYVLTRRHRCVQVAGNSNPSQIAETLLGKVAARTGKPYAPEDFAGTSDMMKYARDEVYQHGMSATEPIWDPKTGRKISPQHYSRDALGRFARVGGGVLTGTRFFMKLHHQAEGKEQARASGAYSLDESPAKGGPQGSKRVSLLDVNALLSHGATQVLRDASAVRGQRNDDYWLRFMEGHEPPEPDVPLVYTKFLEQLKAAGVNVVREGGRLHVLALTRHDVHQLAGDRTLENGETARFDRDLKPVPGGLFDDKLTGGHGGRRWAAIALHEPVLNPAMEEPARRLLGLTQKQFEGVITGEHRLPEGTGPQALAQALENLDVPRELARARAEVLGSSRAKRDDAVRRLGYLKTLDRLHMKPGDWVLDKAPVLPPVFRPVSLMGASGLPLISDANLLYKDLFEADRNLRLMQAQVGSEHVGPERLAVYHALKAVTGLGDPVGVKTREKNIKGILKGIFGSSPKLGAVQRKLISSTVDNVGRGVVAPDPSLDMDTIGLPESMAFGVYQKFLVRRLARRGVPPARALREVKDQTPLARRELLAEMAERPVIVNRAPVLHKFGILAFRPRLEAGHTIKVSPLVVKGFGMDFDGDAVQFHVPTDELARREATERMLPSRALLSPADFQSPVHVPGQEYVGGLHKLTSEPGDNPPRAFRSRADVRKAYRRGELGPDDPVAVLGG